jgi:hypothetical protein
LKRKWTNRDWFGRWRFHQVVVEVLFGLKSFLALFGIVLAWNSSAHGRR